MIFDLDSIKPNQIYGLMTQTIIPRPIAWVLSDNGDGRFNLAPFSYFTGISSHPPLIMISIGLKKDRTPKDTRVNIQERHQFVLHIPTVHQCSQVEISAEAMPAGESEVSRLGLSLEDFPGSPLPRLQTCQVAMACRHHQTIQLDDVTQAIIIGRIQTIYVADTAINISENGRVRIAASNLNPLGRLGADEYASLGTVFNALSSEDNERLLVR